MTKEESAKVVSYLHWYLSRVVELRVRIQSLERVLTLDVTELKTLAAQPPESKRLTESRRRRKRKP